MYVVVAVSSPILPFVAPSASPGAGITLGPPAFALDLEAAHVAVRRAALALEAEAAPAIDLAPVARALEQTFGAIYDAFDGRADRAFAVRAGLTHLDAAGTIVRDATRGAPALAAIGEHLDRGRAALVAAEARLSMQPSWPPPEPGELRASVDVPRLHAITRPSLSPSLRVAAPPPAVAPAARPIPKPKTFAELGEAIASLKARGGTLPEARLPEAADGALPAPLSPGAPTAGLARDPAGAVDDLTFLRGRARECFEDVAMVGMQRAPLPGDPWRSALALDRRMLAAIDVVAAIGPAAIEHIPRLFADAPVKDPSHGFALAMVLGCFRGRDALAVAEHALLGGERDAAFVEAFGAALKLSPHDALLLALRSLAGEPYPEVRAMAVDVLGHRGLATVEELSAAARDEPKVAASALLHLATMPGAALEDLLGDALLPSEPTDRGLRRAVWMAMAIAGHPRGARVLHAALEGEGADDAALLLALTGDQDDAVAVVRRMTAAPSEALAEAAGWSGAGWAVASLVDLLEHPGEEVRVAAGAALERITAAGLREEVEVAAEDILVPEPPEPAAFGEPTLALAQIVGDGREPPPSPAPDRIERPSTDPSRWRAYLQGVRPPFDEQMRYRRGQPYTPLVSLEELDGGLCSARERWLLQRELVVRTGGFVRFDPHDLVGVQEEAIRAWRPIAARASSIPGRWARPPRQGR